MPATAARLLAEGRGQLAAGRLASAVAVLEQVPADGPTPELRATLGEARWQEYLQRTAGKPGKPDPADAEVRAALKDFEAAGTAVRSCAARSPRRRALRRRPRPLPSGPRQVPQATPTLRRRPPTPRPRDQAPGEERPTATFADEEFVVLCFDAPPGRPGCAGRSG